LQKVEAKLNKNVFMSCKGLLANFYANYFNIAGSELGSTILQHCRIIVRINVSWEVKF